MNIKVTVGFCICFWGMYGPIFLWAAAGPKKPVVRQAPQGLKERMALVQKRMATLIQEQDSIKKKITDIDKTIADTIQRQKELEGIGITEEEIQVTILLEVSRLSSELEKFEKTRTGLIEKLEANKKQVVDTIKEIDDLSVEKRDSDVIAIAQHHKSSVPWDGKLLEIGVDKISYKDIDLVPKPFKDGKAEVVQLPALGQARSVNEHTNYCGYYTVYNTVCLLQSDNVVEALLARARFNTMFLAMLREIKNKRKTPPYDNLAEDEIEDLLRMQKVSDTEYVCVEQKSLGGPCDFTELTKAIEASGSVSAARRTIETFKGARSDGFVAIFNVGGKGAHWVAIKVQRHSDGVIRFMVTDSLNLVNWKDDAIIKERLVPLYDFVQ